MHGIPGDIVLKDGDIVSVDCGTYMNGFCGDSAYTFCVGEVDEEVRQLLKVTKEALYIGIQNAVQGKESVISDMLFSNIVSPILMVLCVNLSVMVLVKTCTKTLRYRIMVKEDTEHF